MEFEGSVFKIMPASSGVSARGEWHRQDVVFEMVDGTYSRKICVTFFNKKSDVESLSEGASYKVSFNLESREYNGKWYNDIRAWRIQPSGAADSQAASSPEQSSYTQSSAPLAAPAYNAPMPSESSYSAPSAADNVDDLPF